jgi:DNA gyrase subunit B
VMANISRLSRRYPRMLLNALIYLPAVDETKLNDQAYVEDLAQKIQAAMEQQNEPNTQYTLEVVKDAEKHIWLPKVTVQHHGVFHDSLINRDLFISSEYRKMITLGNKLNDLLQKGAYIQRGEKKQNVKTFAGVFEWIMSEAKKGQSIQRYKGLGEMNPEQLWETTMDPDVRRLLQVTVEDAVAADHIFTTLMGDQVEPRRDFIEANAQEVENLDI